MAIHTTQLQALTLERLHRLIDPGRVYYRPVVFDIFERGEIAEIRALITGAEELKAEFGDFDGLIKAAQVAARKSESA